MIRAKQGVYKVFLGEEVLALNRLGFSGPVIDAMIQTTRNSQSEEKRRLAEQETQAEMRKLRAQLQKIGTELKALQRQQKQEMENRSTSGLGGASIGDVVAECAKRAVALKVCERLPFPANHICNASAESQSNCPMN